MINGLMGLVLKDDKMMGRDVVLGHYLLDIRSVYSFKDGQTTHFKGIMNNPLKSIDNTAQIAGTIAFRKQPQLGNMTGGRHTETGIKDAIPLCAGVPLPKILGDISAPAPVAQALPPGWEQKVNSLYLRCFWTNTELDG